MVTINSVSVKPLGRARQALKLMVDRAVGMATYLIFPDISNIGM
jgi:hypothetical protein